MKRTYGERAEAPRRDREYQKSSVTNSANMFKITPEAISEDINQKKFWGSMPPDPPRGDASAPIYDRYTFSENTGSPPSELLRSAPDKERSRYVYGVDTQASASKAYHVILEIITFQRETKSWR